MPWPNSPVHPAQRPPKPSSAGNPLLTQSTPVGKPNPPRKDLNRPAGGLGAFKNKV